jgi:hypothetical protein
VPPQRLLLVKGSFYSFPVTESKQDLLKKLARIHGEFTISSVPGGTPPGQVCLTHAYTACALITNYYRRLIKRRDS